MGAVLYQTEKETRQIWWNAFWRYAEIAQQHGLSVESRTHKAFFVPPVLRKSASVTLSKLPAPRAVVVEPSPERRRLFVLLRRRFFSAAANGTKQGWTFCATYGNITNFAG